MNKVKGVFSKIGAWIKAHTKICIIILVVVILAIILIANLVGGAEKRAIKKYLSAVNSNDEEKIIKATNIEAATALYEAQTGDGEDEDFVKNFNDYLKDIDDSSVKDFKKDLEDVIDMRDNANEKTNIKLLKIEYSTPAKDCKDLKKVVIKYRAKVKSDKDDEDNTNSIWKNEKSYTYVTEDYMTLYLYKGKVIGENS